MDLYDEFGNYVGGEVSSGSESSSSDAELPVVETMPEHGEQPRPSTTAIVLHEDKRYYQEAEQVYGAGTETLVQDEDTTMLSDPTIKPRKQQTSEAADGAAPDEQRDEWMRQLLALGSRARNVAVIGHLHSGKTALCDVLLGQPHSTRYCDSRTDEQQRGVSLKSCGATLVAEDSRGTSFALNAIDVPGHAVWADECSAALALSDGAVLVVDAVEGLLGTGVEQLRRALSLGQRIVLVLNKIDRLILELRLPPADCYYKLRSLVDSVNSVIAQHWSAATPCPHLLSPVKGNVVFASCLHGWVFSLKTFAATMYGGKGSAEAMSARLWGDVWLSDGQFTAAPPLSAVESTRRSFVTFVLEPLYKIYSLVVSSEHGALIEALARLSLDITPNEAKLDVGPLVRLCMSRLLSRGGSATSALVDAVARTVEEPRKRAEASADLSVHVVKCVHRSNDAASFDAWGRVVSGVLRDGDRVKVLGEHYTAAEEEDMTICTVEGLWLWCGRRRVPVTEATAGMLVLIGGVSSHIVKTATILRVDCDPGVSTFRPLVHAGSVVKVAIEPVNPSDLPKMIEGIRRASRAYPALQTRVEESGEHVLIGPGELYLDCVLHDLRHTYSDMEVKVSDPAVTFQETVIEASRLACHATTPNKQNRLTVQAAPLDARVVAASELGLLTVSDAPRLLEERFGWDVLAVKGLWAFGPTQSHSVAGRYSGTCALLDDTLTDEDSPEFSLLSASRASLVQGFQWACKEGPLTEDPLRGVCFKLVSAKLATEPFHRGGGQLIPTARRVLYSAMLTAAPRLMEPVYRLEVQCPPACTSAVASVVSRRRGHVVSESLIGGTPLVSVVAHVPVIDSFGLETDLRSHSQGLAFGMQTFDHWALVPGDPLDRSIVLRPLEPAPVPHLAREFLVKTRRRKGLSDDVSIAHFFDADDQNAQIVQQFLQ